MTTYLTIHRADRTTEHCAVHTRHAAAREINNCLAHAGRCDLFLDVRRYGDAAIDDAFRDAMARHLGENYDADSESLLPLAVTDDPRDWDICEHPDRITEQSVRYAARVVRGWCSDASVCVEKLDTLEDRLLITVLGEGDHGGDIRQYLRVSGQQWRDAMHGVRFALQEESV